MPKKTIVNFLIVQDFLKNVAGDMAVDLVRICERKGKDVTDEELAKKMGLRVTEVRTVLNRLHYRGIACYQKTKNKKTGWYAYTWNIRAKRVAELLVEQYSEELQKLERKIGMQSEYVFFSCKNICDSFPFEIAAEYQFKCPVCGKAMSSTGKQREINKQKKKIVNLKSELEKLQEMV